MSHHAHDRVERRIEPAVERPVEPASERPPEPVAEVPCQPEIPRSRFALGLAQNPRELDELRLGQFGDGQRTRPADEVAPHRGRFSEGQELLGDDDPEKHIRRRFSEGQEAHTFTEEIETPT